MSRISERKLKRIRIDYENGIKLSELARLYKTTKQAISYHAKRNGWIQGNVYDDDVLERKAREYNIDLKRVGMKTAINEIRTIEQAIELNMDKVQTKTLLEAKREISQVCSKLLNKISRLIDVSNEAREINDLAKAHKEVSAVWLHVAETEDLILTPPVEEDDFSEFEDE